MGAIEQSGDYKFIPMTSVTSGRGVNVTADVYYFTQQIVNVIFVGKPGGEWVLIDCGMPHGGREILEVAEQRFGKSKPAAIILTHGHFDHVGGIKELEEAWQVPVYAHPLEFPFLTGKQDYPEPDPSVEGGVLAKLSSLYPHEAIDISPVLHALPSDGSVPFLPGWQWIATPGHSPGQVALFRESDRTLISGDAFITVKQDSLYKVLLQKKEVCGPPVYLTTDWNAAERSVLQLDALRPERVVPGHGKIMEGQELQEGLHKLATEFGELAVPSHGKWV